MVAGNWLNYDGLYLQFGTQKAVAELGGEYLMYGPWREIEVFISPGALSIGLPANDANTGPLPTSFQGTVASQTSAANTGIVSYTTLFPLQPTAPVTAAAGSVLTITNPQLWIDQVDWETFVTWSAGGGSGTGLTGIGLVVALPVTTAGGPPAWAQVTPNAGVQLLGASTNAKNAIGMHYTIYADSSQFGTSTNGAFTAGPVAGSWMGNVPLTTLVETMLPYNLPNNAYISAIVSSGQYTQATAGGLSSIRIKYRQMYTINDASQI